MWEMFHVEQEALFGSTCKAQIMKKISEILGGGGINITKYKNKTVENFWMTGSVLDRCKIWRCYI